MAKLQSACQILGIRDESYLPKFSKDDIEKIRRKTKEVYKASQKEGKVNKAKEVLDAWKVVDAAFAAVKARRAPSSSKHGSSSQQAASSKESHGENGHHASDSASNKRKAEALDEAATEREKAAALKRAAEKAAAAKKAKEKAAALKKAAEQKAAEKAAHIKKLRSEHRARLAADPPRPCLEKRPSYHRNQSALICKTCQQSSNLRRIPDLKDGVFVCPVCRFRDMDPLSPMKENEKGLLKLILLQPPVLPEETMGEATVRVRLNIPNLQRWRKQGEEIDVRMLNLDTCDTLQCWPHSLTMWANGVQAFQVEAPKEGHKRRDAPRRISACLKSDQNDLKISMRDGLTLQRFCIAIVRVKPIHVVEMRKSIRPVSEDGGKKMVQELLWNSALLASSDEVTAEGSNKCRLTCPLTHERIHTPVRGERCAHLQCFDLKAYIEINKGMAAFNKRWTCPVCSIMCKPSDMFLDMYMLTILEKTEDDDDEICFTQDGEWTVTGKIPPPPSPDSDMEEHQSDQDELAGKQTPEEDASPEVMMIDGTAS
ncbi:PIAL2 [Symbiodinium natans]|uniref:PIAL2 protein n=1 Tax=Symbiodinium natans TaxID=878477 RepID=A0A812QEY0_9DINO|nr:PIAL2 [Symbiodinium natans]